VGSAAVTDGARATLAAPSPPREPAWRRHLAWAAVTAAYLLVFPYFARVNNPNENVRIWTTRALATHGTFAIEAIEATWGQVGDRAATTEGRRTSSKAPGTTLLGVPVHFVHDRLARLLGSGPPSQAATTWVLRVLTVSLPLSLFFFYFGRRVEAETGSPWARDLLVVGLGLGTMLYPYGLSFVGHAQSAALLMTGFLLIAPADASPRRLAAGGALCGLSVVFEYQALFGALVIAGFALAVHRRRAGSFALGAAGPALLLAVYQAVLFGRPWALPYAHLDDASFQAYHHSAGFLGLGRPRMRVLGEAMLAPDYGLFVFSPFLLAGLVAAVAGVMNRRDWAAPAAVVAVTAAMALFISGLSNWRGGWCAGGPRYIASVVPFLAWAIALAWREQIAPRPGLAAVVTGLVLASVVLCGLSGAVFPHFPLQFDNPIFDLVLPLLREGFAPHSLGTLFGLAGPASLVPLALAFAVALGTLLAAPARRALTVGVAALVAAMALGLLSRYGRQPNDDERHARQYVHDVWEPSPRGRLGTL
jgi:hypothetical protein